MGHFDIDSQHIIKYCYEWVNLRIEFLLLLFIYLRDHLFNQI